MTTATVTPNYGGFTSNSVGQGMTRSERRHEKRHAKKSEKKALKLEKEARYHDEQLGRKLERLRVQDDLLQRKQQNLLQKEQKVNFLQEKAMFNRQRAQQSRHSLYGHPMQPGFQQWEGQQQPQGWGNQPMVFVPHQQGGIGGQQFHTGYPIQQQPFQSQGYPMQRQNIQPQQQQFGQGGQGSQFGQGGQGGQGMQQSPTIIPLPSGTQSVTSVSSNNPVLIVPASQSGIEQTGDSMHMNKSENIGNTNSFGSVNRV